MATPLPLEGDGLVENLFHYLWTTDDLGGGPRVSVPPTVIYRGSQPIAWYFTSRNGGRIKRKHRANLTAAHIEHSFTKRKAAKDIVAYFLYLPKSESTSPAIEYFDVETLRDFLFKRPEIPHSSSPGSQQSVGILQQFSLPKGARNSMLRTIWSPKLCLLERRVNIHAIHDARFSVYERGVTFEEGGGAEALSRPEPVRGSMLPGMVQQLCERVVDHVTRVSYHKFRIARMVLRLQVDADDRLWFLWCSSLRLQPPLAPSTSMLAFDMPGEQGIRPLDIVSDAKVPTFAFAQGSGGGPVSLAFSPEVDEEPRPGQTRCASCAEVVAQRALLPTTYKAVLAHFQYVLKFLRERLNEQSQVAIEWPPDDRVVQQAGGVGFGILRHLKSVSSTSDDSGISKVSSGLKTWQGRELLVPPVIRYMHPTLRAEDFTRHRQDPIFLHKTVGVCEHCCLVYADYATASLEANGLGIRSSASAPALLRPVREKPKHAGYFDDDFPGSLLLTATSLSSSTGTKTKPPASAWKPVPTDERQQGRSVKVKAGSRSTLHSFPMAPKLPPRIDTFESEDNDALRIPDGSLHDDGSPQHQQQHREDAFFRELYQQKDTAKRGSHPLRHILEAADRLSKAKPQHRLAALGDSTQIGQSQSTGALVGAIAELKLAKNPGKSPYSIVQRIRCGGGTKGSLSKNQATGNGSLSNSPIRREAKPLKKISKKKQDQGEGSPNKTRFISSREKRAAAEHRGYLVAALSDAQVQLEHIESLATLVIAAPDIEADQTEGEPSEKRQRPKKKGDKEKRPQSPQEHVVQEEELQQEQENETQGQHESQPNKLKDYEEEHRESQLDDEKMQLLQNEDEYDVEDAQEHVVGEVLENPDFKDEAREVGQHLLQEVETPFEQQGEANGEEGKLHNQELYEDQSDATQGGGGLDEEALLEHEKDEKAETPFEQQEQVNGEAGEIHNQELYEEQSVALEHQDDEALPEHGKYDKAETQPEQVNGEEGDIHNQELYEEQSDATRGREQLDGEALQGHEKDDETETLFEQQKQANRDEGEIHNQELYEDQSDTTQGRELLDEEALLEHGRDKEQLDESFLEHEQVDRQLQGQELHVEYTGDEGQDHPLREQNEDHSLTPLSPAFAALEDDSGDDAVIAADSAVASALPLPSSDESTSAANDE